MKKLSIFNLLFLSLCLSACQPKQQTAVAQQKFVCQTLIDGFLKTQSMSHYRLDHVEPTSSGSSDLRYTYKAQQRGQLQIQSQQAILQFDCQKYSTRKFQIKLHEPENLVNNNAVLLAIALPEQQISPMLTYSNSLPKLLLFK